MADETYPSTLPKAEIGSFSYGVASDSVRTDSDDALYYRRRRSETMIYTVSVSFIYSDSEMEDFREWYTTDLSNGSEIFDIDLAFGDGLKTNTAKFVGGEFNYSYLSGRNDWEVTAKLEVWAPDVIASISAFLTLTDSLSTQSKFMELVFAMGSAVSYVPGFAGNLDLTGADGEAILYIYGSGVFLDLSTATGTTGAT